VEPLKLALVRAVVKTVRKMGANNKRFENTSLGSHAVAQLYGQGCSGERSFDVAVNTADNLVGLQTLARNLSQGECATQGGVNTLAGVTVREVATGLNGTGIANSTTDGHASEASSRLR